MAVLRLDALVGVFAVVCEVTGSREGSLAVVTVVLAPEDR